MDKLQKELKNIPAKYASIPFWSWNDKLTPEELTRQIEVMKEKKFGGFFMHARGGLQVEYLSDEWFDCTKACIDKAKELGMKAWAYDENGWPSGFAGGLLLKDESYYASYLKCETKDAFDKEAFACYKMQGGKPVRADGGCGAGEYVCVYRKYDSTYVDVMNGRITDEFIRITHAEYKKRFPEDFGKDMPGFFTDEPQYFRWGTAWSDTIPEIFKAEYGYDIMDNLAALFIDYDGAEEVRYDYFRLLNMLYTDNFIKRIYDWSVANGAGLTGHSVEEAGLSGQMWCCAGIMPFYEYETIPGMDWLGRPIGTDISPKQVSSVAAQLGKEQSISEMFACCGWDVTPKELKKIAEWQYAAGINLMCQHLMSYSIKGQRKKDYPASYSEHLKWYDRYEIFNEYFTKLGYLLTRGEECVNTLLISPIRSAYLNFKREMAYESVKDLDQAYADAVTELSDRQIGYHIGDEWLMEKYASVEGDVLKVGKCSYKYVVLPKCLQLDKSTAELLKKFLSNGGKLYMFDGAPDRISGRRADLGFLKANVSLDDIARDKELIAKDKDGNYIKGLRLMSRNTEEGRIFYLVNLAEEAVDAYIDVKGKKELSVLDMTDDEYYTAAINPLHFEEGQSYVLVEKKGKSRPEFKAGRTLDLGTQFKFAAKPENALTLDYAELSYDGKTYERARPIELISDILLKSRYRGDIYMKFTFEIEEIPEKLTLAVEPNRYKGIFVNGKEVGLKDEWWLDRSFKTVPLDGAVKKGSNEIVLKVDYFQRDYVYYVLYGDVSETLKNCLNYDTELESVYLFGDFALETKGDFKADERNSFIYNGGFRLKKQQDILNADNVIDKGYTYFAGTLELVKEFELEKPARAVLKADGRFAVIDVSVNGKYAGNMMFDYSLDITPFLKAGKNEIKLSVTSGNRNLLGPHHNIDPESFFVSPHTFTVNGTWNGESSPEWRDAPSFVYFGIKKLVLEME